MLKQPRGERTVGKSLWFTQDEWEQVERRMKLTGSKSFAAFARSAMLDGELRVVSGSFDPREVRAELARIGNNLNQIARLVNTDNHLAVGQVMEARRIMQEVQKVITKAVAQGQRRR